MEAMGRDIASSDDEDIPTKPRNKVTTAEAKQLAEVKTEQQELEEMRKELAKLRRMKEVILENRDSIPAPIMEKVDEALSSSQAKEPTTRRGRGGTKKGGR